MRGAGQGVLQRVHRELGWPHPKGILQPRGAGPRVLVDLARRKLQSVLDRMERGVHIKVGVLSRDSTADDSTCPLAIVCEFPRPASADTIREAHRLAWNFARAPLLVTLEPNQIRAWTCCEAPTSGTAADGIGPEIPEVRSDPSARESLCAQAAKSLHWIELVSGRFFEKHQDRFRRDTCADRLLLSNLSDVRRILVEEQGLEEDVCHDLLARTIFIKFLIDRKDSSGQAALSDTKFAALHKDGVLSHYYPSLTDLFQNYDDTYALFQWLNRRFNGDLFPGSGRTRKRQNEEWAKEKAKVSVAHLRTLAAFLGGEMGLRRRQGLLWPHYSFDVIPLEFISSIYEEFVTKKNRQNTPKSGTVYTPPHLVDFILDGVLPWTGKDWNLRILDPACGSGIFLVKAYQRLIWRWKTAHRKKPSAAVLTRLLARNLFGVDRDEHAVRVASFSLYLAMCDEIDPRYYWTQVAFPNLRGRRLIAKDFFREDVAGFRTAEDARSFDLVVGNAPWGRGTLGQSDLGLWAREGWASADNNIGPMFLPKAAALAKPDGHISMLQPSGILTNRRGTASRFRREFFERFQVEEVVNLATLRFGLYKGAIGPSCIVTFNRQQPSDEPFPYVAPKELKTLDDDLRIVVEPQDVSMVYPDDAARDPIIWSALTWGGPRDLALIRRLARHESLHSLWEKGIISKCRGIVRGNRGRRDAEISGRRILESERFPEGTFLYLNARRLPENNNPCVDSRASTDYSAFAVPQLIIKQGWQSSSRRFEAAIVRASSKGVLCSQSYTSIHMESDSSQVLERACLVLNSRFATFYLTLTSGRMAHYIPTVTVDDLLSVPLPGVRPDALKALSDHAALDGRVRDFFGFQDSEWVLIDDLFEYTLPDFKGDASSPGRLPTRRPDSDGEPFLEGYCQYFFRVLKASFGQDKRISATIFSETDNLSLPVRLVAIHLNDREDQQIRIEGITSPELLQTLMKWDKVLSSAGCKSQGAIHQRIAEVYGAAQRGGLKVPTVYLIKPDRRRYWTRSMAMRDADGISCDIMTWWQNPT